MFFRTSEDPLFMTRGRLYLIYREKTHHQPKVMCAMRCMSDMCCVLSEMNNLFMLFSTLFATSSSRPLMNVSLYLWHEKVIQVSIDGESIRRGLLFFTNILLHYFLV